MAWTLLLLLTVTWLGTLAAGVEGAWTRLLPPAMVLVLLYRLARGIRRG